MALAEGPVIVPGLGGDIVLGYEPVPLIERYGDAFRLIPDADQVTGFPPYADPEFRQKARDMLKGPVAFRLGSEAGWSGYGLAFEPLLHELVAASGRVVVGFGIPNQASPAESPEPEAVLRVEHPGPRGRGATVLDLSRRPAGVDRKGELGILEIEQRLGEPVRLGPGQVFAVLVVCTGNSCRSPMAEGILNRMLENTRAFAQSAGTDAPVDAPATEAAVEAAREHGADISAHRARQLSAAMVSNADLVLVMEDYHRRRVVELVPEAASRTRLLAAYLPGAEPGSEIEDPVGRSPDFYRQTAARLATALEQVAREVRQRL